MTKFDPYFPLPPRRLPGAFYGVGLQSNPIGDKPRHPYAVKFSAYIFVANVLAFVIVARWLHPFGFVASLAFGARIKLRG